MEEKYFATAQNMSYVRFDMEVFHHDAQLFLVVVD
jgi:hypothetical protein